MMILQWSVEPLLGYVYITTDGVEQMAIQGSPAHNTAYSVFRSPDGVLYFTTSITIILPHTLVKGRRVVVETSYTGGTVSQLRCLVRWARWP